MVRLDGQVREYQVDDSGCGLPEDLRLLILAVQDNYGYLLREK